MRQLSGAFRVTANTNQGVAGSDKAVLVDNLAGGTGYTTGQQSVAVVTAQPTIATPWTVYGFGVHGRGALGTGGKNFGRLGQLYAAIMFGGTYTPQDNMAFTPLPNPDAIPNIIKLWDGSQDPPWPLVAGIPPEPVGGYFQGTLQLPQPQQLGLADQIAIMLWLTPSLTNNVETMVRQAAWNVIYDY